MYNESERLNNVKKSCKTASTVINVFRILFAIIMAVTAISSAVCFFLRDTIDTAIAASPDAAKNIHISYTIMGNPIDFDVAGHYGIQFALVCLFATIVLLFLFIALTYVRNCFKVIVESENPFTENIVNTLKKAFILVTIFTLISSGVVNAAFLGLFLWCIFTIFQYGQLLQQQADETL